MLFFSRTLFVFVDFQLLITTPFSITLQRYYLFNYRCGFYPLSVGFSPNKVLSVGFRVRIYEIMYTVYQKDFEISFFLCTFAGRKTHYHGQTITNTKQTTTTIVAMHTDRHNRYAILPHTWHGRMDRHRMGTHIRLPIRHTLRWHQRYHHCLSGGSTALHRHHSYLHYHILPAQTQSKQNDTPKNDNLRK